MKITIKNYRNLTERNFTFGRVTALVGANGTGKTTVLDALRASLDGSFAAEDVGPYAAAGEVVVEFDDGTTVSRRRTASGLTVKVNGAKATNAAATKYVEDKLGASLALVGAMLGQESWSKMQDKDVEKAIFSALPIALSGETVLDLAQKQCGLTPEGTELLNEMELMEVSCTQKTLKGVYDACFRQRTDANREEKRLATIAEAMKQPATDEASLRASLTATDEAIAEEKAAEKASLTVANANEAALKGYRAALAAHDNAVKAAETATRRRQELAAQLASMDAVAPDAAEVAKARENLATCQRIRASYEKRQAAAEAAVAAADVEIRNLGAGMCSAKAELPCPHAQGLLKEAQARKDASAKIVTEAKTYLVTVRNTEESWAARTESLQKQAADAKTAEGLRTALAAIVVPEIPAKPVQPVLAEPQKTNAARLQSLLRVREATLRELAAWERWQAAESTIQDLAKIRARAIALDSIVKAFDPKGRLSALVIERVLAPLEGKANETAKQILPGLALRFSMEEKGLTILFRRGDGEVFRPMRAASNGEFILVVYLLMRVLGAVENPGLLTLDNLDALDAETLGGLVRVLEGDRTVKHTVIAAVAHTDTVAVLTAIPGVDVVRM